MSVFLEALAAARASRGADLRAQPPTRWLYVPYDQLSAQIGPLSRCGPDELGLIFVESSWKAARRPYHKQKLALVLANMRQFALEQGRRGYAIHYVQTEQPYDQALRSLARPHSSMRVIEMMEPAERELRKLLEPLRAEGLLRVRDHEGWLSSDEDFEATQKPRGPWRMDRFYRRMRLESGLLMREGKPLGGKLSFDSENRQPWKGQPPAPEPPRFEPDEVTREVCQLVEARYSHHPGTLDPATLPATSADAAALWTWAKRACMEHFGPYEDAMSRRSSGLFHTRISALLNLHRLLARSVVHDVAALDIPLPSKEGFIRQVLGWREFVRHVHRRTDGLRGLPRSSAARAREPGDAGYGRWKGVAWRRARGGGPDGGAKPNALGAHRDIPPAFWGTRSGFACLDAVVADVWREAYSHHITRLMVLSNLAALLDVEPRQMADWFWVAYADAFDWVVEPNVLGMGLFATGELMTTKPYVSGAPYINRMSDYCAGCRFDPKKNCPITSLYWAYLDRHRDSLAKVHRLRVPLAAVARRSETRRERDAAVFDHVSRRLAEGLPVEPDVPAQ